ncbi:CobW family GTP-binding protein [Hydrogenophaga sp. BPS33]|uniref:CobW family GTP-binding protein n=1 Tax=Hydrogenophaga sp. BPS33 TaxID=2651974 RepID=UPI001357482B|nr:CobW family GTP-binding protein [Hydrogenophaga sp. BPS33]
MDLITGFLGSGKTTLINAVLRDPAFAQSMVIVNEFGSIGLDHLLISSAEDNVVLLESGCLCCAASGSLRDTLIDLFASRTSARVPDFKRIIVETSGLAHPAPLLATLLSDSAVTQRCELSKVVTLVDAALGFETLTRYVEARRQVGFADRLVISKTDTATTKAITTLRAQLGQINGHADVVHWQQGQPAAPILTAKAPVVRPVPAPAAWLRGPLRAQYADDAVANEQDADAHGAAFAQVSSKVLHIDAAMCWQQYALLTSTLTQRFGRRVLRCKGLVAIADDARRWVVQGVQGHFSAPTPLAHSHASPKNSYLVCILESVTQDEWDDVAVLLSSSIEALSHNP